MLQVYRDHAAEREKEGIPPRPMAASTDYWTGLNRAGA